MSDVKIFPCQKQPAVVVGSPGKRFALWISFAPRLSLIVGKALSILLLAYR
jgi:hypothetical protein